MLMSSPPTTQSARHRRPPPKPAATKSNHRLPLLVRWATKRTDVLLEKPVPDEPRLTLSSFDCLRPEYRRGPPIPPVSSRYPYNQPAPTPSAGGKRSTADREKQIGELQPHSTTPAKKMKFCAPDVADTRPDAGAGAEEPSRPWSLRTRSSACQAPEDESRRRSVPLSSSVPPPPPVKSAVKSSRRNEPRKLVVALSKQEIEDDIFGMTGSRPSRRPKKRPRNVQKDVDAILPAMWLSEVTADMYKVSDFPES